ncbi:hypothetical protein FOCC_FOCC009119, partial [Frankliniella occidentalis]
SRLWVCVSSESWCWAEPSGASTGRAAPRAALLPVSRSASALDTKGALVQEGGAVAAATVQGVYGSRECGRPPPPRPPTKWPRVASNRSQPWPELPYRPRPAPILNVIVFRPVAGIPIVYILLVVPGLVPWGRLDRHGHFLAWCHLVGAVSPWVGSFVYHLFMNLQAGERVYNRLLRLDMFGIWICQSFGALPMVTATVYCLPWNVRWPVISLYCGLSLCGLYKVGTRCRCLCPLDMLLLVLITKCSCWSLLRQAMTAWSPWDRRLSFALPWGSRIVLCLVRAVLGGGSPHNMLHLILQDSVSLLGGVVGAVYFPEKYFPGWVDYCLNSHNIMHILTVAAVYSMHCATIQDLEWIASVDCKPAGPPWPPWGAWVPGSLGAANQSVEL